MSEIVASLAHSHARRASQILVFLVLLPEGELAVGVCVRVREGESLIFALVGGDGYFCTGILVIGEAIILLEGVNLLFSLMRE